MPSRKTAFRLVFSPRFAFKAGRLTGCATVRTLREVPALSRVSLGAFGYTDLGFDHLILHGPGADQERFLTTLADEVVPGLRELVPADLEAIE